MFEIFQLDLSAQVFLVAIFSLIFGSFASLVSHRLASGESMVFARSKCVKCGSALKVRNLIPLFSFIFQRGKCSNCSAKISSRYPLIELSFLITFLTIFFVLPQKFDAKMMIYFLIAGTFIVMSIVDLEQYFIPNITQYFLAALAAILWVVTAGEASILPNVWGAFLYLIFGLALWAFFYFTTGLEAIGVDDLKFFFIVGFMLGEKNFLAFTLLNGILGLLFGFLWQKFKKDDTFPFAPALCLSAFLCLLFDQKINPVVLMEKLLF